MVSYKKDDGAYGMSSSTFCTTKFGANTKTTNKATTTKNYGQNKYGYLINL